VSERGSGFGSFLLGLGIGAVLGFLFAPEPGVATRGKLQRKLRGLRDLAAEKAGELGQLLEADDEWPLPEPYAALSEVAVTRRVYRSGESEYLINKISCRLKDITEFFMAAQIHSRGYALVEQGKIEEIIQAKPSELRSLIEEAAGLSLFKGRREISERKLERVRTPLSVPVIVDDFDDTTSVELVPPAFD